MKKKLVTAMLVISMVAAMTGCGSNNADSNENAQSTETEEYTDKSTVSSKDYDYESLVTLPDYKAMEVTVDTYTFSDADVDERLQADFEAFVSYSDAYDYTVTEKDTIESGDVVNLDYCGKQDGTAFDGGTAEGAHLEIGSNSFIPGFEDGMIGHKVGESFEIPLTFPEDYQNADMAGVEVVFEITVNSIDERKMPEMTDELVAQMGMEYQTVSDYKEYVKNYLQSSCDEQNKTEKEQKIWDAIFAACEVKEAPQELVDDAKARIATNSQNYADYYGVTVEEFVTQNMGVTMEEYEQQIEESSVTSAKEKLAIAALAKDAGITLTDEDVKAYAESEYTAYGYESIEELFSDVGSGPYYDYVLQIKVNEYLAENVKVIENEPVSILSTMSY